MDQELEKAVALTYKEGQFAPQVVAKGRGSNSRSNYCLGQRIRSICP